MAPGTGAFSLPPRVLSWTLASECCPGARLAYVHVKDARRLTPDGSAWEIVLLGEGEVPVREQLDALHRHGYAGYLTVEWEWRPAQVAPEVALAQHIAWLKDMPAR